MVESFDVVFQGNSQAECVSFIRAVRQHAKDNGKIRDNQWIADELYNSFDGRALLWYVRLPAEIQGDWGRLQEALVTRWATDDEVDDLSAGVSSLAMIPTPAAAAPAASSPSGTSSPSEKVGRIRIRVIGNPEIRYLSKVPREEGFSILSGAFGPTTDPTLAMKVRLTVAGHNAHRLELVEQEGTISILAAFNCWNDGWNDSDCTGLLIGVDASGQGSLKERRTTYNGPDRNKDHQFWTDRWQLESTGRLKLRGPDDISEAGRFILGVEDIYKGKLWFVGPKRLLHSGIVETDFEFEPLKS